jgi:hypothetical protein
MERGQDLIAELSESRLATFRPIHVCADHVLADRDRIVGHSLIVEGRRVAVTLVRTIVGAIALDHAEVIFRIAFRGAFPVHVAFSHTAGLTVSCAYNERICTGLANRPCFHAFSSLARKKANGLLNAPRMGWPPPV